MNEHSDKVEELAAMLAIGWYDFLLSCFISLQVTHYLGSEKRGLPNSYEYWYE